MVGRAGVQEPQYLGRCRPCQTKGHSAGTSQEHQPASRGRSATILPFAIRRSRSPAMPEYRSRTSTHGRNMAGARALWRATGIKEGDFGKPIIAVVNSFTQFVPGHVHLKDMGQLVARQIEAAGGVAKEFNTI